HHPLRGRRDLPVRVCTSGEDPDPTGLRQTVGTGWTRDRRGRRTWRQAMSKELLLVAEAVANEKGVDRSVIFEALEAALASAAKKRYEEDVLMRVSIDRATGNYQTFVPWEVVADDAVMESPDRQIRLMDAVDVKPDAQVGDFIEEPVENAEFGRIAAQAAKQVILQKVREAERALVVQAYKD